MSDVVVNVASSEPSTTESDDGVSACPSIVNVTVPVGATVPLAGVTVASNETPWPAADGLSEEVRPVVVDVGVGVATDGVNTTSSPLRLRRS